MRILQNNTRLQRRLDKPHRGEMVRRLLVGAGPKRGSQQDVTRVKTGKILPRGQKLRGDSMDSASCCVYLSYAIWGRNF